MDRTEDQIIQKEPAHPDDLYLKEIQMNLEAGYLGKIFGSEKNAPLNIAGIVSIVLILAGVLIIYIPGGITCIEYWKTVVPILTMILGYLFGKKG